MAIKGTTKIELTNIHTGEKEVVEHHNMITNVLSDMNKRMYGVNGMDTFLYMYAKQFLNANDPFWKAMFSGIILFEDALSDNADEYIFPAGNKVTGCGDIERVKTADFTDPSCSVMGNFNADESVLKDNMVKMVYDFPTSQANGQISSIALCNKLLARSCYVYDANMSRIILYNDNNLPIRCHTKNAIIKSITVDGNTYTITFYNYETDNLKIKLSSKINAANNLLINTEKTISADLGASGYSFYFSLGDKNIIVMYSNTTGKFKYVSLIDGSVSEKNVPSGYDYVYPFDGYFVAIKKNDSLYYYSILKDDGTMLHANIFSAGGTLEFAQGMFDGKYIVGYSGDYAYLFDTSSGCVSKFYLSNREVKFGYFLFNNIYHISAWGTEAYLTWQPWLTTKNNLETPVTKTADKTMKVTYTLTEA